MSNVLFTTRGYIKGVCPGLTHAQKLGISYYDEEDSFIEQNSGSRENPDESYVVESSLQAQPSSVIFVSHPVASQPNEPLKIRSRSQHHGNIVVTADSESIKTDATGGSSEGNTEHLTEGTVSISEQTEDTDEQIASQDFQPNEDTS